MMPRHSFCPVFKMFQDKIQYCESKKIFTLSSLFVRRKYPIIPEEAEKLPVFQYPVSAQSERRVYVWGLADHGALGNYLQKKKNKPYYYRPVRLTFSEKHKVTDVACGYGFTAFAVNSKDKNKVFGCGINTDGQIGHHAPRRGHPLGMLLSPVPIEIPFRQASATRVVQVAAGRAHLLVLTDQEGVYSLGNNAYGQCGRKIVENEDYSQSQIIYNISQLGGSRITSITCGQDHSLFINERGEVFACGWGADGQTGSGHYTNIEKPSKVEGDIKGECITKVASTVDSILALNDHGEVFGWGNSEYGQLMNREGIVQQNVAVHLKSCSSLGKIVDIAAGGSFCVIVNENGDVFSWGYGLLGKGPAVDYAEEPTLLPATLFGRNEFEPYSKVVSVHAGIGHMAAVTNAGNLYTWGHNREGCLGLGHLKDQFFPLRVAVGAFVKKVSCGVDHTAALCQPFI